MNPKDFSSSDSGRCVLTPTGYYTFIPNPLPPRIKLDWQLVKLNSEADRALSELSGSARRLSNPNLLIYPYIQREAVLSSRIENTRAGMSDLFYFEADPSEPPKVNDVREVANYVKAMYYGLERLKELPISGRLVREIHEKLMKGVRGEQFPPGEFRESPNWIGGSRLNDATYVPPPTDEMNNALRDWEIYINNENAQESPLIKCALMHYQFEAIHPFNDGNGRAGRLLITVFLCGFKYLSQPLLYLSAYFERNRKEYNERLLAVEQQGDWRGWIEFFLRGVALQAQESLESAEAIVTLYGEYRNKLKGKRTTRVRDQLLDHLFINPVVSIAGLSERWNIPYPTVRNGVEFFVDTGILHEASKRRRNRLFVAQELLELLVSSTDKTS